MLTIAYIGNGKSTNRYHLPFAQTRADFRVKTIYSRGASVWPRVDGVGYVNDLNAVWDDPEIDLVVVCTHTDTHAQFAREALARGKHVLVEKPFTLTPEEARELFALAERRGLFLACYQNRRFDSDFLTTQMVVASGVLGDLLEVEMHYDYYRPEVPTHRVPEFSVASSFLYGHGVHTVDQVLSWFGHPGRGALRRRQLPRVGADERLLRPGSVLWAAEGVGEVQLLPGQGPAQLCRVRDEGDVRQAHQGPAGGAPQGLLPSRPARLRGGPARALRHPDLLRRPGGLPRGEGGLRGR